MMEQRGMFAIRGDLDGNLKQADQHLSQYIGTTIANEKFLAPINQISEILMIPEITYVPFSPPHIKGVINLRGTIIPVADLREILQYEPTSLTSNGRVLIIKRQNTTLGLIVDKIQQVIAVPQEQVKKNDLKQSSGKSEFITSIHNGSEDITGIIDLEKVLEKLDPPAESDDTQAA